MIIDSQWGRSTCSKPVVLGLTRSLTVRGGEMSITVPMSVQFMSKAQRLHIDGHLASHSNNMSSRFCPNWSGSNNLRKMNAGIRIHDHLINCNSPGNNLIEWINCTKGGLTATYKKQVFFCWPYISFTWVGSWECERWGQGQSHKRPLRELAPTTAVFLPQ